MITTTTKKQPPASIITVMIINNITNRDSIDFQVVHGHSILSHK